ncbi:MAG: hypothetical protein ABIH00_02410 [Armatimonadota bacterium]
MAINIVEWLHYHKYIPVGDKAEIDISSLRPDVKEELIGLIINQYGAELTVSEQEALYDDLGKKNKINTRDVTELFKKYKGELFKPGRDLASTDEEDF